MKKKTLALALAAAMCAVLLPMTAFADYYYEIDPTKPEFIIENSVLERYNGAGGAVVIPNGVTSIGDSAFYVCDVLASVTIPNGVTSIGNSAFTYCENLTSATIANSVTKIGDGAFYGCMSLTNIILPNSVTSIGESAFHTWDNDVNDYTPLPNLTLSVTAGSYAETYAIQEGIKFTASGSTTPAPQPSTQPPTQPAAGQTVNPTSSTVYVNGAAKAFEAYLIDGNNYFKLRDLATVLNGTGKQFAVGYDTGTKAITLASGQPYIAEGGEMTPGDGSAKAATATASKIYLDGQELDFTVYNIGGNNFFKLRDLMKAIDVSVGYDNATKAVTLDTSQGYVDE